MHSTTQDTSPISVNDAAEQARGRRQRLVERLHRAATFIAAHPELEPHSIEPDGEVVVIRDLTVTSAEDLARVSRAIGGRWEKRESGNMFRLERKVAEGVVVELVTWREQVCEAVVVGKETVEVPDPDAPKVEIERDVIEWRCAPILGEREQQAA